MFGEGHDLIAVALKWRAADEEAWRERRMTAARQRPLDRRSAPRPPGPLRIHAMEAWRDEFAIFHHELEAKHGAGLAVPLELEEGRRLARQDARRTCERRRGRTVEASSWTSSRRRPTIPCASPMLMAPETADAMAAADPRPFKLTHPPIPIDAERTAAGFASWYSIFPRSLSGDVNRHGTFDDVIGGCRRCAPWASTCSTSRRSTRSGARTARAATTR